MSLAPPSAPGLGVWRRSVWAGRSIEIASIVVATWGLWLFWSQSSSLSELSWWYDSTQQLRLRARQPASSQPKADYDLATLAWHVVHPRLFEPRPSGLTVVTGADPFAYQAYASINAARGASIVDIQFDAEIETGGATIGLLQAGRWITANSSLHPGEFSDSNSARLGYSRSLTVVVANDNPEGESRLTLKSLRVFFRK